MPSRKTSNFRKLAGALLLSAALFAGGWFANSAFGSDWQSYQTADGRSYILLKRIDDAFPVYAKPFKAEVDLALGQRQKLKGATIGGIYESGVEKLYQSLDMINFDVRTSLIAAYSVLILRVSSSASPAQTAEAFRKWDEVLDLVIKETVHLRELNQQIAAAQKLTSGGEWEKLSDLRQIAEQGAEGIKSLAAAQQTEVPPRSQ